MNIVRADSSQSGSSRLKLSSLPPAMLQKAASRLGWVALACAVTTVGMQLIQQVLQPEVAQILKQLPIRINTAAVILLSSVVAAGGRFGWMPPAAILRLGLLLEVLVGF